MTHPATVLAPGAIDFALATRIVFGEGAVQRLGELAREAQGTRALVVSDPGVVGAGHPGRVVGVLGEAGLETAVFDAIVENPTDACVEDGAAVARRLRPDVIVAVGGGSVIDGAKGIALLSANGGRAADYRGTNKVPRATVPVLAVPTTAGTGSEVQSAALISDAATHEKMVIWDRKLAPCAAVLDPELTVSLPRQVTAVTGIDAIAHAVESAVCARANRLSRCFAASAWQLLATALPVVLDDPSNLPARGDALFGATLAGMAVEQSMLGAAHSLANPLTRHFGVPHGAAVGVMLPHVVRFNAAVPDVAAHYVALAGLPVSALADHLTELLTRSGLPTRLTACGVDGDRLPVLAAEAAAQWTAAFNPRPVTADDLLMLYRQAW
ncbi:MAG: iron-containing alcohol dehydrogenase [Armatimonadota bacterium]|nr:iron-containing alcohol dehydrogenase [Armatimonadota bacterium]